MSPVDAWFDTEFILIKFRTALVDELPVGTLAVCFDDIALHIFVAFDNRSCFRHKDIFGKWRVSNNGGRSRPTRIYHTIRVSYTG